MDRVERLYKIMAAIGLTKEDVEYYTKGLVKAATARHWLVKGRKNLTAPTIIMLETVCMLKAGMWQTPIQVDVEVPNGAYLRKDGKLYVNVGGKTYEIVDFNSGRGFIVKDKVGQVDDMTMGNIRRFVTEDIF